MNIAFKESKTPSNLRPLNRCSPAVLCEYLSVRSATE
uniref:Uncharacterized protein n=1 Tax=Anguilla anguilla TaxID=7936 RepID=A0A0E9U2F1_ANGAN